MSTVQDRDLKRPNKLPEPVLRGDPITGERYTSTAFFDSEWTRMWMQTWQIGGLISEAPEPGDFINAQLGKESILLVHQEDGRMRAFYNVCQHRGSRLTFAPDGGAPQGFTCPYHGWRFNIDGTLVEMPDADDFPGGDPCGKLRLVEVPCEVWAGFVWFNMDPNCLSLQESLGTIWDEIGAYRMEDMVRVLNMTADVACNWKIITDNFNEGYHVQTLHPELRPFIECNHSESQFDLRETGHSSGWFPAHQPSSCYQGDTLPDDVAGALQAWDLDPANYNDAETMWQTRRDIQKQKRALGPERGLKHYENLSDFQLTDYIIYNIFPNNVITVGPDGVQLLRPRPHPTDPQKCLFDHWYFVPRVDSVDTVPSPAGGPDLPVEDAPLDHIKAGEKTMGRVTDQDLSISQSQQLGLNSAGYTGVSLVHQERRMQYFHEVLNDYIENRR